MKKLICALVSLSVLFAMLPSTMVSAATKTTTTTGERELLLFEDDFSGYTEGKKSSEPLYWKIGGWDFSGTSKFMDYGNGDMVFCITNSNDSAISGGKSGSSELYLPNYYVFSSGKYTFQFSWKYGSADWGDHIYLSPDDSWSAGNRQTVYTWENNSCASNSAGVYRNKWWIHIIEVDLDNHKYYITVKDAGTKATKFTTSGTYNFDKVNYLSFQSQTGRSANVGTDAGIYARPIIDDLKFTWTGSQSSYVAKGNIAATNFDDFTFDNIANTNDTRIKGGWDPNSSYSFDKGPSGLPGDRALCPVYGPGRISSSSSTPATTEFYIPRDKRINDGTDQVNNIKATYYFNFDFCMGTRVNHQYIRLGSKDSLSANDECEVYEPKYTNKLDAGTWYHLEIIADMYNKTYTTNVYDMNGNLLSAKCRSGSLARKSDSLTINQVSYISFAFRGWDNYDSSHVSNNVQGNSSKLDNFTVDVVYDESSNPTVYSNDFSSGIVNNSSSAVTKGGWDATSSYKLSTVTGLDGTQAFGYTGNVVKTANSTMSSEYHIAPSDQKTYGQYQIEYFLYVGGKTNANGIAFCPNSSWITNDPEKTDILELTPANVLDNTWYRVEAIVDLDTHKVDYRVTTLDGKKVTSSKKDYNGSKLGYIQFYSKFSSTGTLSDTDISLIDDLSIRYYSCLSNFELKGLDNASASSIIFQGRMLNYMYDENRPLYYILCEYDPEGNLNRINVNGSSTDSISASGRSSRAAYASMSRKSGYTYRGMVWNNLYSNRESYAGQVWSGVAK